MGILDIPPCKPMVCLATLRETHCAVSGSSKHRSGKTHRLSFPFFDPHHSLTPHPPSPWSRPIRVSITATRPSSRDTSNQTTSVYPSTTNDPHRTKTPRVSLNSAPSSSSPGTAQSYPRRPGSDHSRPPLSQCEGRRRKMVGRR
jgi:hypothetical protein